MQVLSAQLKKLPVVSLQTGQPFAITTEPIIQPTALEVVAFHVQTEDKDWKQPVIMMQGVRQIARDCLVVDAGDELSEAGEIVRRSQLLEKKFKLIDLPVVSEGGKRLGKVEDYSVDIEGYKISKIYVKRPLLQSLASSLIIDRDQIVDVTPKQITVREAWVKKPMLSPQPKPAE